MSTVVFDIETAGRDFSALDAVTQEYLLKFADTPEKQEMVKAGTSFYPQTAQIVAIGMMDVKTREGAVYYQEQAEGRGAEQKDGVRYVPCSEKGILERFWKQLARYDSFVTFNGRMFDCPFVMVRSCVHRLRARKNLVPYRFNHSIHVDLADQLTFYDAMRRRFPLHVWCRTFGIESPKADGMNGSLVKECFERGEGREIAEYCRQDLIATRELYLIWEQYLKF